MMGKLKGFHRGGIFLVSLIFGLNIFPAQSIRNSAPYFTNTWIWQIKETDPIGSSPVSKLFNDQTIVLKAFDEEGQRLKFKVRGDIGQKYFTVDEYTGVVKVQKQFDYEVTYIKHMSLLKA